MQLIFVRHGEPAWGVDGLTQTDPHLTDRGHEQAALTARRLAKLDPPIDEILVSPAIRSQETAAPLAAATGLRPTTVDGLVEMRMPDWEGRLEDEVRKTFRDACQRSPQEWWDGIAGGESFRDFHERVTSTLSVELGRRGLQADDEGRIHLWNVDQPDQRFAIVAHAGTNSVSLGWLLDLEPAPWEWERFVLGHCSIATIHSVELAGAHAFSLRTFNDREHLPEDLRTR